MRTVGSQRRWRQGLASATVVAVAAAVPALGAGTAKVTLSPVIVQAASVDAARAAVQQVIQTAGVGKLGYDLPLVNGVAASLTTAEVAQLQLTVTVTADAVMRTTMTAAKGGAPAPPRQLDNVFPDVTGARAVVQGGNGGEGIGVAVIDTGIANLADFSGRLSTGVDFSSENNPWLDSFGHGTFVGGLVGGDGASSGGEYVGEAPGARLVPVKVAGKSGSTSVSTVIRALQWVQDNTSDNIKVINLSLGAIPPGPTALNPLDQAVETMWRDGFVVVASAGNMGPSAGTITSPGDDPLVITVGALDDKDTVDPVDDVVPDFSSRGPTAADGWWKPDLLAPGKSVVSVTSTTSVIWSANKSARVGSKNFVGSGTSFAAAITSGAVAMYLRDNPDASPDSVKAALLTTTNPGPGPPNDLGAHSPFVQGHGVLDIGTALEEPAVSLVQNLTGVPAPVLGQAIDMTLTRATSWASGDLLDVTYPAPYSFLSTGPEFESTAWNSTAWNSTAWNSTAWNSTAWNSTAWNSTAWNSTAWNSGSWS